MTDHTLGPRAFSLEEQRPSIKAKTKWCSPYFARAERISFLTSAATQLQNPRACTLKRTSKCTLQVDRVGELKQLRDVKIPKSVLEKLEVIRQVDRKFILARVLDDTCGSLLLCIDQHAADERVKLEQLELTMFGPDDDDLRIEVHVYQQPLLMLLNAKEFQTLSFNEDIVRAWGFDFEVLASDTAEFDPFGDVYASLGSRDNCGGGYYIELRTTPKVDTRSANAEDFREFIQVLSHNEGFWSWTTMRPPVITRLLHSRACRSAIMFGDYLSISQCRDLVEALRRCKLPFQCAHGRPSVVPLVEFLSQPQ